MLNAISRELTKAASANADAFLPAKGGDDTGSDPSDDTAKASRDQDQEISKPASKADPAQADDVDTAVTISGDTDATPEGGSSGVTAGTGNPSDPEAAAPADTAAREFIPASKLTVDDVQQAPSADEVIAEAKKAVEEDKATAAHQADDDTQADDDDTAGPEFTTTTKGTNEAGEMVLTTTIDDVEVPDEAGSGPTVRQLTAGAAPLPKMAKGRAKWMTDRSAWFPDSRGVHHPPGLHIQRMPFRPWGVQRPMSILDAM